MTHPMIGPHELRRFEGLGFLVLPGLFADDVDEIGAAFDEVFADPANPRLDYNVVGHRWRSEHLMAEFVERHERLDRLRCDPRLTEAAVALLGPTATYTNSDASIYCCETDWHFDTPTAAQGRRHVKFLLYLEPLDGPSGALRILPATHLAADRYQAELAPFLGFDGASEGRTGVAPEDLPHWPVASTPGDVIALDFRVMHAAFGSTEPRRKIAVNFNGSYDEPATLPDLGA